MSIEKKRTTGSGVMRVIGIVGMIAGIILIQASFIILSSLDYLEEAKRLMDSINKRIDSNDLEGAKKDARDLDRISNTVMDISSRFLYVSLLGCTLLLFSSFGFYILRGSFGSIATWAFLWTFISSVMLMLYSFYLATTLYHIGDAVQDFANLIIEEDIDKAEEALAAINAAEVSLVVAEVFGLLSIITTFIGSICAFLTLRRYSKVSMMGSIFMIIGSIFWLGIYGIVYGFGMFFVGLGFLIKG